MRNFIVIHPNNHTKVYQAVRAVPTGGTPASRVESQPKHTEHRVTETERGPEERKRERLSPPRPPPEHQLGTVDPGKEWVRKLYKILLLIKINKYIE